MKPSIVIIAEHENGSIRPVTWELAALARKIGSQRPAGVRAVIVGDRIDACAQHLSESTGFPVTAVRDARLKNYSIRLYRKVLCNVLAEMAPSLICFAHTSRGAELAPVLAFDLSAACISAVEEVCFQADEFRFFRSIYGGKIRAVLAAVKERTVLTLQPGSLRPDCPSGTFEARVDMHAAALPDGDDAVFSVKRMQVRGGDLSEAKVLVAAGRGIGEAENLSMIRDLAAVFPRSAVCGSRPVIDAGWMNYSRQVGVTGATVSPALYVACGVSGALQHVSGMRGSGFVVAINSDPGAAIFNDADVCIVEDLNQFIPSFIKAAKSRTASAEDRK
jgi:electron transfer flavoprotein alpha subunit